MNITQNTNPFEHQQAIELADQIMAQFAGQNVMVNLQNEEDIIINLPNEEVMDAQPANIPIQ